jgi:flavodoxin
MCKTVFSLLLSFSCVTGFVMAQANGGTKGSGNSILIAYFSRAGNIDMSGRVDAISAASVNLLNGKYVGNAELMAKWIQEEVGGDLFLIQTEEPYSADYDETVARGERENRRNIHPALSSHVANMQSYNVIFLGYPIFGRMIYRLPCILFLKNTIYRVRQ